MLLLAACTPEPDPGPTPTGPAPACADLAPEEVVDLDPDGPDTQIHVFAEALPDGAWVAWDRPDDAGLFDVWAASFGCDGTLRAGPFQLDDSADNETDPALAIGPDGRVLVAWHADTGRYPVNLEVRWRLVDEAGPVGPVEVAEVPGNAWTPSAAPTADGYFLAFSAALATVFEVVTLPLDRDGAPVGTPEPAGDDPGLGQTWPRVAVAEDGTVHLAWEVDEEVAYAVGGTITRLGSGYAPSLSLDADGAWIAWGDEAGDLFTSRDGAAPVLLRGGADLQHSVAVAAGTEGGHAAFYENVSGFANRLIVARFDGAGEVVGSVDLGTRDAAPYGLHVARVSEDVVLVGWSEGASPAFHARLAWARP